MVFTVFKTVAEQVCFYFLLLKKKRRLQDIRLFAEQVCSLPSLSLKVSISVIVFHIHNAGGHSTTP